MSWPAIVNQFAKLCWKLTKHIPCHISVLGRIVMLRPPTALELWLFTALIRVNYKNHRIQTTDW